MNTDSVINTSNISQNVLYTVAYCPQCTSNPIKCSRFNSQINSKNTINTPLLELSQLNNTPVLKCLVCKGQHFLKIKPMPSLKQGGMQVIYTGVPYNKLKFIEHKSIQITTKRNNFRQKIEERFGVGSYSTQYWSSVNLPVLQTSQIRPFSAKTVKQIFLNQQNEEYLPLQIAKSHYQYAGDGIKATQKLKKGKIVISYIGQIIFSTESWPPSDSIYTIGWRNHGLNTHLIAIQPISKLNAGRFMNTTDKQKCNCAIIIGIADGRICLYIYTLRDIEVGQQLYYYYGQTYSYDQGFDPTCTNSKLAPRSLSQKIAEQLQLQKLVKIETQMSYQKRAFNQLYNVVEIKEEQCQKVIPVCNDELIVIDQQEEQAMQIQNVSIQSNIHCAAKDLQQNQAKLMAHNEQHSMISEISQNETIYLTKIDQSNESLIQQIKFLRSFQLHMFNQLNLEECSDMYGSVMPRTFKHIHQSWNTMPQQQKSKLCSAFTDIGFIIDSNPKILQLYKPKLKLSLPQIQATRLVFFRDYDDNLKHRYPRMRQNQRTNVCGKHWLNILKNGMQIYYYFWYLRDGVIFQNTKINVNPSLRNKQFSDSELSRLLQGGPIKGAQRKLKWTKDTVQMRKKDKLIMKKKLKSMTLESSNQFQNPIFIRKVDNDVQIQISSQSEYQSENQQQMIGTGVFDQQKMRKIVDKYYSKNIPDWDISEQVEKIKWNMKQLSNIWTYGSVQESCLPNKYTFKGKKCVICDKIIQNIKKSINDHFNDQHNQFVQAIKNFKNSKFEPEELPADDIQKIVSKYYSKNIPNLCIATETKKLRQNLTKSYQIQLYGDIAETKSKNGSICQTRKCIICDRQVSISKKTIQNHFSQHHKDFKQEIMNLKKQQGVTYNVISSTDPQFKIISQLKHLNKFISPRCARQYFHKARLQNTDMFYAIVTKKRNGTYLQLQICDKTLVYRQYLKKGSFQVAHIVRNLHKTQNNRFMQKLQKQPVLMRHVQDRLLVNMYDQCDLIQRQRVVDSMGYDQKLRTILLSNTFWKQSYLEWSDIKCEGIIKNFIMSFYPSPYAGNIYKTDKHKWDFDQYLIKQWYGYSLPLHLKSYKQYLITYNQLVQYINPFKYGSIDIATIVEKQMLRVINIHQKNDNTNKNNYQSAIKRKVYEIKEKFDQQIKQISMKHGFPQVLKFLDVQQFLKNGLIFNPEAFVAFSQFKVDLFPSYLKKAMQQLGNQDCMQYYSMDYEFIFEVVQMEKTITQTEIKMVELVTQKNRKKYIKCAYIYEDFMNTYMSARQTYFRFISDLENRMYYTNELVIPKQYHGGYIEQSDDEIQDGVNINPKIDQTMLVNTKYIPTQVDTKVEDIWSQITCEQVQIVNIQI